MVVLPPKAGTEILAFSWALTAAGRAAALTEEERSGNGQEARGRYRPLTLRWKGEAVTCTRAHLLLQARVRPSQTWFAPLGFIPYRDSIFSVRMRIFHATVG